MKEQNGTTDYHESTPIVNKTKAKEKEEDTITIQLGTFAAAECLQSSGTMTNGVSMTAWLENVTKELMGVVLSKERVSDPYNFVQRRRLWKNKVSVYFFNPV